MSRRGKVAAKSSTEPRSWSSEWIGQTTGRCTTCEQERPVMLIENGACICAGCHETRLEKWRADDIEAERCEMMWEAWTAVADRRLV
jgi:hypothetical protein